MSFMFNPHPYDDFSAINYPKLPDSVVQNIVFGVEKTMNILSAKVLEFKEVHGSVIVGIDGYPSADFVQFSRGIAWALKGQKIEFVHTSDLCLPKDEIEKMLSTNLPEDREKDPVLLYGKLFKGQYEDLMDKEKITTTLEKCKDAKNNGSVVVIYGVGSLCDKLREIIDISIYIDVTSKETMLRAHAGKWKNFGDDVGRPVKELQRRAYYVDFELAIKLRGTLLTEGMVDYYVVSDKDNTTFMFSYNDFMCLTEVLSKYPFRCKPVYAEGVWGGHFIRNARNLPDVFKNNIAWVFELIPMEVSLLIQVGERLMEMPFFTFVQSQGDAILGEEIKKRFRGYFPIRFNYDDTFHSNGNMSIQVHPPKDFCMETFGELGTQDEGYYVVAVGHGARTYCGLKEGVTKEEFFKQIKKSENDKVEIDYQKYVNAVPSIPGRQFLIPGGTVHASGRNQLILEIGSLTIGSYTFKLYDYLRKDIDGNPRPIHSHYGEKVLKGERTEKFVYEHLVKEPLLARQGNGFAEYIVGEDDLVYYSTRRLEFEKYAEDNTNGKFHVLALVDGEKIVVRSKSDKTRKYEMNFLDMVVVPANIGEYELENLSKQPVVVYKVLVK